MMIKFTTAGNAVKKYGNFVSNFFFVIIEKTICKIFVIKVKKTK